jgi:hypothetical protein
MVPTFKSKTLTTNLCSMNPPDSRGITFLLPYAYSLSLPGHKEIRRREESSSHRAGIWTAVEIHGETLGARNANQLKNR